MKKSKIFLTLGTFALAIGAVFATKANKKFFTAINTVQDNSEYFKLKGVSAFLQTAGTVKKEAFIYIVTASAKSVILFDGTIVGSDKCVTAVGGSVTAYLNQ